MLTAPARKLVTDFESALPKAQQEMVAAALRSVFTQQSRGAVEEHWDQVAAMLAGKCPRTAELMASARDAGLIQSLSMGWVVADAAPSPAAP
jgi:transposase-like protein